MATGFDPIKAEGDAKQAALLLRKLGGWLAGVAESEVLRQRQAAEAEAKARREAKPKTGFRASDTT